MDDFLPIIRAALDLAATSGVIAFALARRRKRVLTSLELSAPSAARPSQPARGAGEPT
jgi:hypothetical protein